MRLWPRVSTTTRGDIPLGQQQAGTRVAEVVEADLRKASAVEQFVKGSIYVALVLRCSQRGREDEVGLVPQAPGDLTLLVLGELPAAQRILENDRHDQRAPAPIGLGLDLN